MTDLMEQRASMYNTDDLYFVHPDSTSNDSSLTWLQPRLTTFPGLARKGREVHSGAPGEALHALGILDDHLKARWARSARGGVPGLRDGTGKFQEKAKKSLRLGGVPRESRAVLFRVFVRFLGLVRWLGFQVNPQTMFWRI